MPRPPLDDARLATLIEFAGLDFGAERRRILLPVFEGMLQQMDALDAVEVNEAAPIHAFDPRWGTST